MDEIHDLLDVVKLKTTPFHPEADGISENGVKKIKTSLKFYTNAKGDDWDEYLDALSYAFNTSEHCTTRKSAFEIEHGRTPKVPLDLFIKSLPKNQQDIDFATPALAADGYANELKNRIDIIYEIVTKNRDVNVN